VREFLDRPEVGARHCIAALHDLEGGETFALAAIRPREAGFFDEADKAPLTRIAPHVRRLAAVEMRLQHNDAWRTRLESMLDESGQALAAVTATSRLIYANRPAEALFRAASHVAVRARHLCATHVRDDDMLRRAIAQSAAMGQGGVTGNGAVGLAGARGAPVLFARLWPLPRSRMVMGETEPLVLIAFAPTTRPVRIGADAARVFALTPRERDVIEHLCNRENVASAAAHLGLSVQTVRSYLKSAMLKTGVSSQKDLVKLFTQLS
jgi:DNA-binding CsgD family transcriptional regulator